MLAVVSVIPGTETPVCLHNKPIPWFHDDLVPESAEAPIVTQHGMVILNNLPTSFLIHEIISRYLTLPPTVEMLQKGLERWFAMTHKHMPKIELWKKVCLGLQCKR